MGDTSGAGRTADDANPASRTADDSTGTGRTADRNPPAPDAPESEWKSWARHWERLAKENGTAKDDLATRLQAIEDKDKSELQKAQERAEAAERQASEAGSRALRLEVAAAKGLPPSIAGRLKGKTRAELEADADELLTLVGKGNPESGRPDPDQGRGSGQSTTTSSDDMNAWYRSATGHRTV